MRRVRGPSIRVRPVAEAPAVDLHDVPVDAYRDSLYAPGDLYDAEPYAASLDARAFLWAREQRTPRATLAQALHDHAIDQALASWVSGRHLVGVMGGHDVDRASASYADAARLGWMLGQHAVVTTGGGPGAMEAANLGGLLAAGSRDELASAVASLAGVPSYRPSVDQWAAKARAVTQSAADHGVEPQDSLGIPTWFYGEEPPNLFASAIAKYFRNAIRESILLQVCDAGIVFLPGLGGTVQEIFQDACENFYAAPGNVAPMVLVGRTYWSETLPAWPLLQALAKGRPMADHIHLVATVEDAAELMRRRGSPSPR
ncbi:MAG TPA: Rossmann fold nucleotide-binding protein [Nocardioides sp.]|uniref:LOG family protein n=1 Tax=Nocardioides sp. TaxID=35761 RepID=UPI002E2FA537|nr:Rossmann fold nucleotide-binding protein [Nocardioides sp.]HEX3931010.1 Rossmann fold nucleotide-binding protein [Nocardioides sp.]